jgi:serine/threonine protein kinase
LQYTPAVDIWSIGCIFAELLTGKPLFPGKNVVHQLDIITDLLGTPSPETIARIRNEKARRYLSSMRQKTPITLRRKFPNADTQALHLLQRLLEFDPRYRISAEEALAHPYFKGLANLSCEPSMKPISKLEFGFERRKLTKDDVRELIYREILEYHPQMLKEYLQGAEFSHFMYPSGLDQFKIQFANLEEQQRPGKCGRSTSMLRKYASLPRERVCKSLDECEEQDTDGGVNRNSSVKRAARQSPAAGSSEKRQVDEVEQVVESAAGIGEKPLMGGSPTNTPSCSVHYLSKSSSIVLQSAEV